MHCSGTRGDAILPLLQATLPLRDPHRENEPPVRYTPTMPQVATPAPDRRIDIARDALIDAAILAMAYLIATYFRRTLPVGKEVGPNYQWFDPRIYLAIILSVMVAHLLLKAAAP